VVGIESAVVSRPVTVGTEVESPPGLLVAGVGVRDVPSRVGVDIAEANELVDTPPESLVVWEETEEVP